MLMHMYSLAWRQFLTQYRTGTTSRVGTRFPTANSARPQGLVWAKPRKSQAGDLSPKGQEEKERGNEGKGFKIIDGKKKSNKPVGGHQLSHTYAHLSSPLSRHLSIIAPFQHHCISLHHFITHRIIYKPPFIHLTLSIFAIALSLPICSSISLPSGSLQSVCSILFVCVCHICVSAEILTY